MQTFDYEEFDNPRPHRPKLNKEKYCKKNKLRGGQYGSHLYNNGRCKNCDKIDPQLKKKNYFGEKEYVKT